MKTLIKIIYVLCIIINSSCEDISDFDSGESKPVVEAFIYEGESVDDIYLKKTVPFNTESKSSSEIISDAIITISGNGQDFILTPVTDQPGRYIYDGNDLSVNIGDNYQLTFEYEDIIISSTTTIPSEPEGVDISPQSIFITEINSLIDLRNFRESFQKTINVTWNNADGSYYYLVIENIENNPRSIDPTDVLGGLGINFEFTTTPTQENVLSLRPLIHFTQYGTHRVTIYHVNEEYALLYETSTQDSRDLNEPYTNINNGLGIFSGFASQEVYFEVTKQ
jgi:hypothetical protein